MFTSDESLEKGAADLINLAYQGHLLDVINDAVIATDTNFAITYWNKAAERTYGWTAQEALGRNADALFQTVFNGCDQEEAVRRLMQGENVEVEVTHTRKGGSRVNVISKVSLVYGNHGQPTGTVGVLRDITERKEAEEALRFQASILRIKDDAIIAFDNRQLITYWSPGAQKMYGWTVEEALGKSPADILRPLQYETETMQVKEERQAAYRRGELIQGENIHRRKDGSEFWVEYRVQALFDRKGTLVGFVTLHRDVTERKEAEEQLRFHSSIAGRVGEAIFATDASQNVLFWNKGAEALYGWRADEAIGRSLKQLFTPMRYEGEVSREQAVQDYIEKGWWRGEASYKRKDGSTIHVMANGHVNKDQYGKTTTMLVVHTDITERKRIEEELKASEERQAFLLKLSDSLRQLSDPLEIQHAVTRIAMDYFGADRCYYCEIENDTAIIRRDASRGDLPPIAGVYPLGSLPIHKSLINAGLPFIVADVRTTEMADEELKQICIQLKVTSYLDVPVIKGGKPVGIFCIVQSTPRNWTELQAELAVEIAERVWAAVERAKDQAALRDSEERLLALMKATSDVIYRMSPDWKTMTELYGRGFLADTEAPDNCWLDKYIHPDDQKHVTEVIESCIRDKRIFELEHRVLREDGTIGWTYSRAVPLLSDDGVIREWFGAASDITGRRRSEAALRESEAKYHNLFDSIDEGYCIVEVLFDGDERPLDYRFLEVNKSFEKQTGIVNAVGRCMRALAPNHEQNWFDTLGHTALTGEPIRLQGPAEALGRFYDVYAYRVGKPEQRRVAILFHDITDRKIAEEALREKTRQVEEANQQKEDILESMSDCFYVLDKDLRFTYVNTPAEEIWGLSRADLIGRKIEDVFPGIIDISLSKFHQVLQEKSQQHYEVYSKVIGRWGDMGVYPMRDGISVYFRDITERKKAEEVLQRSQEREAFLLKLSDALRPLSDAFEIKRAAMRIVGEHLGTDCIMYNEITDDGKTIHIDDNYVRNGYPKVVGDFAVNSFGEAMDVLRRGEILVINGQTASALKTPVERRASTALGVYASATVPLIKEGCWVKSFGAIQSSPRNWTEDEIAVLRETAERTWAAVERAQAAEALRESENHAHELVKELEQADRNKNQFLSALSHELRNPLAAISAGLQVLDIAQDPNQTTKAKGIMNRQINQLCHLVDDLLDLTRISHNKIKLRKEAIELNGFVLSVVEDNKPLYKEKGIKLTTDIKGQSIYVNADPTRIRQIIGNLLTNALKFTNAGGETLLSVYTENDESVICVKDTGIGIMPETLSSLFTPFHQADTSLDRRNGGLGLGLSIVKGMAELHGGSVSAFSEGLGKGSTFKIQLPLYKNGGTGQSQRMSAKEKNYASRILLIEDNRDFADTLCSALTLLGHEVLTAEDGMTGIAKAREYVPDVIFCDIGLPEMDGYEVARRIRSEASIQGAYMIALTGYANQGDSEKALESGFNKHLAKPIDLGTIKEMLDGINC